MSKTKNSGLDQYGAESFEQQQFGTAGVEGVKSNSLTYRCHKFDGCVVMLMYSFTWPKAAEIHTIKMSQI